MITIWHNPRCSKSRQALALLEERGADIAVRRYLDDPPTEEELRAAQALLDVPAIRMMRTGEPLFGELRLTEADPDDILLRTMAMHPRLIERPLVFAGDKAVIGRPPERVLEVL